MERYLRRKNHQCSELKQLVAFELFRFIGAEILGSKLRESLAQLRRLFHIAVAAVFIHQQGKLGKVSAARIFLCRVKNFNIVIV